ncbi:MAG TPA: hypothetical protein PKO06_08725 [Candidatus Ozemobacteraceae bacterium]|nr:hypothetical protein [Candidatus Ozemobacteraceae bacterium]
MIVSLPCEFERWMIGMVARFPKALPQRKVGQEMKTLHDVTNVLMIMSLAGQALALTVWAMAGVCMMIEIIVKCLRGA